MASRIRSLIGDIGFARVVPALPDRPDELNGASPTADRRQVERAESLLVGQLHSVTTMKLQTDARTVCAGNTKFMLGKDAWEMLRMSKLAEIVNGSVSGDPEMSITGAASLSRAGSTEITFMNSGRHLDQLLSSHAAAVIVPRSLEPDALSRIRRPVIRVDNPEACFSRIVAEFRPPVNRARIGISDQAHISPTAKIGENVDIYPGAYISDDVEIGPGTVIHPNVTIMEGCRIGSDVRIFPSATLYDGTIVGDRCILHASVVLGAYGFGYKTVDGRHQLSSQLGNVVIEQDVEIGAGSTIDRGTYESTVIGEGSKLDDQVMIGHNCRIGKHNLLCSQVGIAGSCSTGHHVTMAGQVGVGDHITIGDNVVLHGKCGVMGDVEDNSQMLGAPANPIRKQMQILAISNRLPEMRKQMKEMMRTIESLQQQVAAGKQDDNGSGDLPDSRGEAA